MSGIRPGRLATGILAAGAITAASIPAGAVAPRPAQPATQAPAVQAAQSRLAYQQAQQDLRAAEVALADLDGQLQAGQLRVEAAGQVAAQDARQEEELRHRIGEMARAAYQTEGSELSSVLEAHSIGELWDALAEARVVSERQDDLLQRLDRARRAEERLLDQARAQEDDLSRRRAEAQARVAGLESQLSRLSEAVQAAGQVIAGAAGRVPAQRLPQTTGVDGQCTWYAEQAWTTYSDPGSPVLTGDGADVVPNLARALGRPAGLEPQPGALVSWQRPLLSAYGHVAYVAAVDRDPAGNLTGYTVWEMNYMAPFATDVRHLTWIGASAQILFMDPPQPVDPPAAVASFGPPA